MFHRQNQKPESTNTSGQDSAVKERPPIETYVKNEKEKSMYQNQTATQTEDTTEGEGAQRPLDIPGNPSGLQRNMQPPRMPGSFPASYAANTGSVYGSTQKAVEGRRLVVGEGIALSGEIESCDILIVEGTIEAALKGAKILEIAESGIFYGTVEIEEATIAGRFEGDLTVSGRLTIRSSGSITGSVAYKELAVEAGATLDGKVTPISGSKSEKKPDARAPGKKVSSNRHDNGGNELPFADKASVLG